ncbi:unnamed protein product [Dibothriocephalus latus]|uniref:GAT domain-containing protein n=1 Tax=Dibothriocephalus latus TaxID=60516 RepID=A0A3P7PB61_DIBLA|nr:unnamed protein product [Dibothriocephalus latus]
MPTTVQGSACTPPDDVALRNLHLTPSGTREAPELVQKVTAPDTRTTQLVQAIRRNLDLVALDLPVFEAMVQGLACTPTDDVTLKQLHTTADRLQDLQRKLEACVVPLTDSMDPKFGGSVEREALLEEVMRVNKEIHDNVQLLQSFERMLRREKEVFTLNLVAQTVTFHHIRR